MRREATTAEKVRQLLRRLGEEARRPGRIYLVGGASAVLIGWRETTVDVDLKLAPEPPGVFEAIARAKEALNINVELAAPDDFIPPLPGWQARSPHLGQHGRVSFFHYDFYAQALAKIERAHQLDWADVRAMSERGLIEPRHWQGCSPPLRRASRAIPPSMQLPLPIACVWRPKQWAAAHGPDAAPAPSAGRTARR